MENLERSFRYPFSGEEWKAKIAFGGILCILAFILGFIPWLGGILCLVGVLIPLGYSYKIFRDHLRGAGGPLPPWEEWGDLFTRGWFVFLVSLGYWIIPGVLYWLGKALWHGGGIGAFLGVLFLILGIGIGLVSFFLFPMALAFFSKENESFAAAFRWSGMVEKIWMVQRDYFAGWVATLIFFLVLVFVRAYFLYVGWILFALGLFYLSLVAADFFGRVCRESMEVRR